MNMLIRVKSLMLLVLCFGFGVYAMETADKKLDVKPHEMRMALGYRGHKDVVVTRKNEKNQETKKIEERYYVSLPTEKGATLFSIFLFDEIGIKGGGGKEQKSVAKHYPGIDGFGVMLTPQELEKLRANCEDFLNQYVGYRDMQELYSSKVSSLNGSLYSKNVILLFKSEEQGTEFAIFLQEKANICGENGGLKKVNIISTSDPSRFLNQMELTEQEYRNLFFASYLDLVKLKKK